MMNLAQSFESQMCELIGQDSFRAFTDALNEPPQVAFRPNLAKGIKAAEALETVPWSSVGRYLSYRPSFTFDPLFHGGAYYVQEPSSMFIEQALKQCGSPHCVLDLCASPGGKSTLLRSLLPDDCLLVCNEPIKTRAQILLENMIKWGHPAVIVTNNYPKDFSCFSQQFDVIAVDAPCSGEGMFRKDNPALEEWTPQNVEMCAERQFQILHDVWPALAEGGTVIYSTCTYNLDEDERNVLRFCEELGAEVVPIPTCEDWNVTGNLLPGASFPVYRFMPHLTKGEGFFLCLIRKISGSEKSSKAKACSKTKKTSFLPLSSPYRNWLTNSQTRLGIEQEDTIFAVSQPWAEWVSLMFSKLHVLSAGIPLAVKKGSKYQPHHALSMSICLQPDAFTAVEVEKNVALDYLRRQSLCLSPTTPRGYVLLTYKHLPLGFVNNLGAHANNLYPQNWKIRSSYNQDSAFDYIHKSGD